MAEPGGDSRNTIQAEDSDGDVAALVCAISELAKLVGAPSPNCSIGSQSQTVELPCGNSTETAGHRHTDRGTTVGRCAITQLAIKVVSPTPGCTIRQQRQTVGRASRDGNDA